MLIKGKYGEAEVFTNNIEDSAKENIISLLNQDFTKSTQIKIMPDVHACMNSVVGLTMKVEDKVLPSLVGEDIGCGMLTVPLGDLDLESRLPEIDQFIKENIPAGPNIHDKIAYPLNFYSSFYCKEHLRNERRIRNGLGTLGGGNHFIEINKSKGNKYLIIHSGSKNLGAQVARYYQKLAISQRSGTEERKVVRDRLIKSLKQQGRHKEIQSKLRSLEEIFSVIRPNYPDHFCCLTGELKDQYLHDMQMCQQYAELNREIIASSILKFLGKTLAWFKYFHTNHNYFNENDNILRKGSIAAYHGQKVVIPINMREGTILAVGKGNRNWNYSAPHGAGRVYSRTQAKKNISLDQFKKSMQGIYTTSVNENTIDESPEAYKSIHSILPSIKDTVEVVDILKPIYNFKYSGSHQNYTKKGSDLNG